MKRRELLPHLNNHGCELIREGGNHSWWLNPLKNKRSAIPRHSEVQDLLVRKICKGLDTGSIGLTKDIVLKAWATAKKGLPDFVVCRVSSRSDGLF